jgi:integrase
MMEPTTQAGGHRANGPAPATERNLPMRSKATHAGIRVRHSRSCPLGTREGARCNCTPGYEAWIYSKRERRKIRKTFPTLAAAKSWRADASVALRKGVMRAPSKVTLREAAEEWLAGAKAGTVRTRSGDEYKPSALRGYEASLRGRILRDIGGARLSEITRRDVQDVADRLIAEGLDPSTIRNVLMPLRAIFRRSLQRGDIAVNPTSGLALPAVRGRRERYASPDEAKRLLEAVPEDDRPIWATAMYAGLRLGELRALRVEDVDLASGVITVERAWDARVGVIPPKSRSAVRRVPIPKVLRGHLAEHRLRIGRTEGLIFGRSADDPFKPNALHDRAQRAWRANGLEPIGLHECRHTFASLMIAAGVNAKALSTYMGHSTIQLVWDRYGHLMPGNIEEAAGLLDTYLERASLAAASAGRTGPSGPDANLGS